MEKFSLAPSWVRTGEAGRVSIRLFTVLLKPAVKEENAGRTVEQNRAAMQVRGTLEPMSREGRGGRLETADEWPAGRREVASGVGH